MHASAENPEAPKKSAAVRILEERYAEAWRSYRWWNRWGMITLGMAALIFFAGLIYTISTPLPPRSPSPIIMGCFAALFIGCILFTIAGSIIQKAFPCPRCHEPFSMPNILTSSLNTHKCCHCGLKLYSPPTPEDLARYEK